MASKRKGNPEPTSFIRRSLMSNSRGALAGCALLMMSFVSVHTKRSTMMLDFSRVTSAQVIHLLAFSFWVGYSW